MSACALPASSPDENLVGDWVLISGTDEAGDFDLSATSITLTIAAGEGSGGRTPCNSYFATITGGGDYLSVRDIAQTEAACIEEELMELERRYLAALAAVDSGYIIQREVGGSMLELTGTGEGGTVEGGTGETGIELRFEHPR